MKTVVFPGSFDPVTYGHIDLIERLKNHFEKVIVLIGVSIEKKCMFSPEERKQFIEESFKNVSGVNVDTYDGLTVSYLKENNCRIMARGIRSISDFELEMNLAQMNKSLNADIETFFLLTSSKYSFVASRYIKEVAKHGGNLSQFVPPHVVQALQEKL